MTRSGKVWVRTSDGTLRRVAGQQGVRSSGTRLVSTQASLRSLSAALQWATSTLPATVDPPTRQALVDTLSLAVCAEGQVRPHELGCVAEALVTCPVFAASPRLLAEELVNAGSRQCAEPPVATLRRLRNLLSGEELRRAAFRLAAVAVLADAHVWSNEPSFLSDLARALGLPPEVVVASVEPADALLGGSVAPEEPGTGGVGGGQ